MGSHSFKRAVATSLSAVLIGVFAAIVAWGGLHSYGLDRSISTGESSRRSDQQPSLYLWAWERPEDLRFLNGRKDIGVAFLAETIHIVADASSKDGSGVVVRPRQQPLRVNAQTPLMAVVRVETEHDLWHQGVYAPGANARSPIVYTEAQRRQVAELVAGTAALPRVTAVQIDFDASQSELGFYASLLEEVRRRLPRNTPLSITALASWCIGDPWLNQLPAGTIDEAVPMLFRMGPDATNVSSYMQAGKEFRTAACRSSLGLSTDETFSKEMLDRTLGSGTSENAAKRIYIFSDHAWTRSGADPLIEVEK
jgi:Protein of unknown function (DUF3142)